jgi:hypothetical protein
VGSSRGQLTKDINSAMAFEKKGSPIAESWLDEAAPFIQVLALLGIPAAGAVALVLAVQLPRFIYGDANIFLFPVEIGSLAAVVVLVLALRICLALPSAPAGFYRTVLDFLAMARWHPAVKVALVGLAFAPAWYIHGEFWRFQIFRIIGWRALRTSDLQSGLDGIAVMYQLALTGGVPLLFTLHLLSRTKSKKNVLLWLLVPVLFVATAAGVVLLVVLMHS